MSPDVLFAVLLSLCSAQEMDCSEVAIIEVPNTNIVYVANCIGAVDKDGYELWGGMQTAFHMMGEHVHHKLYFYNAPCQKV